ncbi:MAG: c-type cytochrome [Desulfitobacteriaceae bacterium]
MKLGTFALISILSMGGFIWANYSSIQLSRPIPEEAVLGKRVWQTHQCVSCHTLFGNGGYNGDDLTNIVSKRSSKELLDFMTKPPVMRPNHQRLHPGLSLQETKNLISYLEIVHKIPTLGWPPEPNRREGNL